MIICKSASEIEIMKEAGQIVARVLLKIEKLLEPGIATGEIDRIAEKTIRSYGAIPAFKGYMGRLSSRAFQYREPFQIPSSPRVPRAVPLKQPYNNSLQPDPA